MSTSNTEGFFEVTESSPTISQFLGGEPSAGDLGWKQEMGRYFAEWGPEWAADLGMLGGI